jgi:hypothetical protein
MPNVTSCRIVHYYQPSLSRAQHGRKFRSPSLAMRVIPDARPRVSGRINWRWDHTDSAVGLSGDTGRLDLRCIADCLHGDAYRRQSASAAIVDTQRLSMASKMAWLGVVAESLRELTRHAGFALPVGKSLKSKRSQERRRCVPMVAREEPSNGDTRALRLIGNSPCGAQKCDLL